MNAPIEELLADTAWLRRLTLRLAGNAEGAADLEQEVAVAALRARGKPLGRPWLWAVARRLAALGRRREQRETRRLERLVPEGPSPGAAEVVAEAELQQRAVRAVLALPEHYRDVVLLRFLRGLSVEAVARELGVGVEAVRTRQKRALGRLRAELLPERERAGWWGASIAGVVMATNKKVAAAVALVLVAWGTSPLWLGTGDPVPIDSAATAVAAIDRRPEGPAVAVADVGSAPVPERTELPAAAPEPAQSAPSPAAMQPQPVRARPVAPTGGILVTVVDPAGQPAGEGRAILCRAAAGPGRVLTSDAASLVRFDQLPAGRYLLGTADLRQKGVDVIAGSWAQVTVPVAPGARVTGRVVDAVGQPVPFAQILVQHASAWPSWPFPVGRADAAGRFEVGGVGHLQLVLAQDARLGTTSGLLVRKDDLKVEPADLGELRFRVQDRAQVRGRVVDTSGFAVPHAWVQLSPKTMAWASDGRERSDRNVTLLETDGEGRFAAPAVPAGRLSLYVYAKGLAPHRRTVHVETDGVAEVEVVLRAGATVRGVVRDVLGQPVAGAYVQAEGLTYPQKHYQQSGADGSFEFDDIAVGRFEVAAWQKQVSRVRCEVAIDGPGEHQVEIVLTAADCLKGRLLNARGEPLAFWYVERPNSGRWTATDAEGRFVCVECALDGNELRVRPNRPGEFIHTVFTGLRCVPQEQVLVVADDCMPTAIVRGRCLDATGRGIEGVQLRVGQFGFEIAMPTRTGADGGFELGPLPAGKYRVQPRQDGRSFAGIEFEVGAYQRLELAPVFDRR